MRIKLILILLVVIMTAIFGLHQSTLQKLKSDSVFNELNMPFWAKEQEEKTKLWSQAVLYCDAHGEKPNCGPVMQVFVIMNGSTAIPTYGSSGHSLTTPDFN